MVVLLSTCFIRCFIESVTSFFYIVRTCLVAGWAGGTFDTAENDLATGIGFFAMISVDAKVMCIVKTAFVIPVAEPVQPDFFEIVAGSLQRYLAMFLKEQPAFRDFSMYLRSSRVRCF